jgi:hypothetical protein
MELPSYAVVNILLTLPLESDVLLALCIQTSTCTYFPLYERPSFTFLQNTRTLYNCSFVYLCVYRRKKKQKSI